MKRSRRALSIDVVIWGIFQEKQNTLFPLFYLHTLNRGSFLLRALKGFTESVYLLCSFINKLINEQVSSRAHHE